MTAMYKTTITATFEINVKAESSAAAEQLVDGILGGQPVIAIVSGSRKLIGKPGSETIVRKSLHWQKHVGRE